MKSITGFIKNNIVLIVAFMAAAVTMFFVPPSMEYLGYIDLSVIILLFCLMGAVAGLRSLGVFDSISAKLLSGTDSARIIAFIMMNLCFFFSMVVTNDVALITFVPLTLGIYSGKGTSSQLITTVVIETAAANIGSMLTPIGNPQNLFLYKHYSMSADEFFCAVIIYGIIGYVLLCASVLLVKKGTVNASKERVPIKIGPRFILYTAVFILSVLSVADIVNEYICLGVAIVVIAVADYMIFTKIDYSLLLTFVCFFIFVGNLGNIDAAKQLITSVLVDNELLVSALLSQIVSNVPAAAMLADFTDNAPALLCGVNIGGLGTPIASLASLISYRFYCSAENARRGRYMLVFLAVNIVMLAIMLVFGIYIL